MARLIVAKQGMAKLSVAELSMVDQFPNNVMLVILIDVSPHDLGKCSLGFSHPLTHDVVTVNHLCNDSVFTRN